MQCPFCKREVPAGTTECPYCHYQFEIDAEVLSSDERDSFQGLTIEEDGSTAEDTRTSSQRGGESYEEERPTRFGQREENPGQAGGGFHFHTVNSTGCLVWLFIILFILMMLFFGFIQLLFAFPALGLIVAAFVLNNMFHWF